MEQSLQKRSYSEGKAERLEARLSREQKTLLQYAADLVGRSLTDFVLTVSQEAASKVIRDHKIIALTVKESEHFVNQLQNNHAPNTALKKAIKRYRVFQSKKNNENGTS